MTHERISEKLPYPSHYVTANGAKMHYVEAGEGDPILLLHGIPTSCYLWRNIIPHLAPLGRCIAPDLIGFGRSDKPEINYSVKDHISYIEKFIDALNLKQNLTIIMHGFGSIIGFDYAMRHQAACKGLVFYEAFLRSLDDEVSLPFQEQLSNLQDDNIDLTSNGIAFVDTIISQTVMRELTEEEMKHYREPFMKEGSGKPILRYLHDLKTDGGNDGEVLKLIADYSEKLTQSTLPKLLLYSVPGFITTIATVMWAKENLPNLEIIDLGEELHLAQESSPQLMGEAISVWMQGVEQRV